MTNITENELLEALRKATECSTEDSKALTTLELQELTGWGNTRVRTKLRHAIATGSLECIRISRISIDGTARVIPAYRVVSAEKDA